MDVREKYVMQKVNRKEKSICPNCIHHNLCIAENNQPCFECNRFIDAHGVTVQEWIPVTERLPEQTSRCLVARWDYVTDKPFIDILWFEKGVWWNRLHGGNYAVTHWMPLPEPPKGE